jgi:hypothetical protein
VSIALVQNAMNTWINSSGFILVQMQQRETRLKLRYIGFLYQEYDGKASRALGARTVPQFLVRSKREGS